MARDAGRLSQSFVPAALAASSVGSWDYDVRNDRLRCDGAMAALYGFSPEEASHGCPMDRLTAAVHPDDQVMLRSKLADNVRFGGVFVIEYRVHPSRREMRWVLVRGRYDEADDRGRMVRSRGIVVDITESKRDGYADGDVFFMTEADSGTTTALDRAARHLLAARRAIDDLGPISASTLRPAVDEALSRIGHHIAGALIPVGLSRTDH